MHVCICLCVCIHVCVYGHKVYEPPCAYIGCTDQYKHTYIFSYVHLSFRRLLTQLLIQPCVCMCVCDTGWHRLLTQPSSHSYSYIHTYLHTYIEPLLHTYIESYIHTYIHVLWKLQAAATISEKLMAAMQRCSDEQITTLSALFSQRKRSSFPIYVCTCVSVCARACDQRWCRCAQMNK
jgi:hypothetical protein